MEHGELLQGGETVYLTGVDMGVFWSELAMAWIDGHEKKPSEKWIKK